MAKTKVVTSENTTVEWEGDLLPGTMVTINGKYEVPLGSFISMTHGEALNWLAGYLLSEGELGLGSVDRP